MPSHDSQIDATMWTYLFSIYKQGLVPHRSDRVHPDRVAKNQAPFQSTAGVRERIQIVNRISKMVVDCEKYGLGYLSTELFTCGTAFYQVNDESVQLGHPENRPCRNGNSMLHKLRCGHIVITEKPSFCGKNCQQVMSSNLKFYCLLCLRREQNTMEGLYHDYWHDLLLPTFINYEMEKLDWDRYKEAYRASEPVHIAYDGTIVVPVTNEAVATIRAAEFQHQARLEQLIRDSEVAELGDAGIKWDALEYFHRLINRNHGVNHASLEICAALAVEFALLHVGREFETSKVCEAFKADPTAVQRHREEARTTLTNGFAEEWSNSFIKLTPRKVKLEKGFKKLQETSYRIWSYAIKRAPFKTLSTIAMRKRIMAACFLYAASTLRVSLMMADICDIMGIEHDDATLKYYNKIRRFCAGRDWAYPIDKTSKRGGTLMTRRRQDRDDAALKGLDDLVDGPKLTRYHQNPKMPWSNPLPKAPTSQSSRWLAEIPQEQTDGYHDMDQDVSDLPARTRREMDAFLQQQREEEQDHTSPRNNPIPSNKTRVLEFVNGKPTMDADILRDKVKQHEISEMTNYTDRSLEGKRRRAKQAVWDKPDNWDISELEAITGDEKEEAQLSEDYLRWTWAQKDRFSADKNEWDDCYLPRDDPEGFVLVEMDRKKLRDREKLAAVQEEESLTQDPVDLGYLARFIRLAKQVTGL
ncbi:hypothetical protein P154DRAFT_570189 [Amniculicola lignicola CBS 123094]|uniref:Uncharacterized protein n=1 Tax=Amniculicola lignicola CBS 123094 TaxID=1392246 RepID=A0A6A5X1X7_9PLEO|nr:hypothetical protein P154DRAFT_570189 [Amniculicola lignicola CBS 123094]